MNIEKLFKGTVATVCAYETVAILSQNRVPTITSITHRHPVLGVVVLAGLSKHLYAKASEAEV